MSYDILVFEPDFVSDADFPAWWEGDEPLETGFEPEVMTPSLRSLYRELRRYFPALNGPDAVDDATCEARPGIDEYIVDYGFAPQYMYISVSWPRAGDFVSRLLLTAPRHGIAIARVSDDGEILRP